MLSRGSNQTSSRRYVLVYPRREFLRLKHTNTQHTQDAERSDSDIYHFEYDKTKGWIPKRGKGKWAVTKLELQRHEDDVVMLEHINEAMISHNIRKRYEEDKIYTWCGASKTVLISVNPFKWDLPLYVVLEREFCLRLTLICSNVTREFQSCLSISRTAITNLYSTRTHTHTQVHTVANRATSKTAREQKTGTARLRHCESRTQHIDVGGKESIDFDQW